MKEVTKQQVVEALKAVGVQPGDGLLIHSALQFLGRPVGGVEMYFEALCEATHIELGIRNHELGVRPNHSPSLIPNPQLQTPNSSSLLPNSQPLIPTSHPSSGTIAVPTFTFAFARGEAYDPQTTPSVGMGMLSEYVRQQPSALRTPHPMQSLAVIGAHAADLAARDTPSAFDHGSSFERMLELGFKILLLGVDIDAISMIHYSEQRYNVPYRYWKEFTGQVRTLAGWEERTYRMFARDLELDPQLTLHSVRDYLQAKGQYYSTPLNYGQVALIHMTDFVQAVDCFLAADPYSLMIPDGPNQT